MEKNLYLNSARFYDKGNEIKGYDWDINFYRSFVQEGTKVLELGCGTGRITLPLIASCKSITAIDFSEQMLEILQQKVSKLDADTRKRLFLQKDDMCSFNTEDFYDLIIFPGLAFMALTTDEQRRNCLSCAAKHLAVGGKIVLDMIHPDEDQVSRTGNVRIDFEYFDEELNCTVRKLSIVEGHDKEKQTQGIKYTFELLQNDRCIETIEDRFELAYLYRHQLQALFEETGFSIERSYGWYDFSSVDPNNKQLLIYVLSKQ